MSDPWAAFNPQTADTPTPIIPRTPAPQTPAQLAKDIADARKAAADATISETKASEESGTAQKQAAQKADAIEAADQLVSSIERAKGFVNNWSTGIAGHVLRHVDATDAAKLQAIVDQEIRGNIFLNKVANMKAESDSPTGGTGIGRIMQAEIPLITGSLGSLDPARLGPTETMNSLVNIEARTLRTKAILNGENPDDPAVQKKYKIPALPYGHPADINDTGGTTTPPPPGVSNLSGDQKHAYDAFLSANPNPSGSQVSAFLTHLTGQTVTNGDEIAKAISQGRGVNTTVQDLTEQQKVKDAIAGQDKLGIDRQNPASRVFMHGATLNLSDEAAGVGNAAANVVTSPFTGKFDPVGSYRLGRDVERQRLSDAQSQLGGAALPVEFAGNLVSGNPEGAAANATSLVLRGAKAGGAYGAIAGYGAGQGTAQSLTGAGIGGVTGAALGAAGGRFFDRGGPPPDGSGPAPGEIANALQTEGIPAARPIADPSKRGSMAYLETTRGGGNIVRSSLAQTRQSIADKVAGVAGPGEALTPGGGGEMVQNAGTRTLSNMKTQATRLYDQASTSAADAPIQPTNALATLDGHIADLSRNPNTNKGVLSYLKSVRSDLASGNKTVADIRDIRTGMSGEINRRNLTKSNAERIMGDVMNSARSDVTRDLGKSNPDALGLYNKADDLWSQMHNTRQQVVEKLVGPADNPISGEQTMSRVRAMMGNKGDLGRFKRLVGMMEPDEQATLRSTLFNGIGQRSPEEPFSPAYFLSQTRDMQPGALQAVFGEDGAKSIQNLRVASKGFSDAQASLNNSRSGFVANFKDAVSSILTLKHGGAAGAGYAIAGLPGAAVGAAGGEVAQRAANGISAKLLMNPDVSQWIRKVATAKTEQQAHVLLGKLNTLAAGNAGLQNELGGVRDAIVRALNDNTPAAGTVAASPNKRPDQQQ